MSSTNKWLRIYFLFLAPIGCGSVGGSDPAFWDQSRGAVGRPDVSFLKQQPGQPPPGPTGTITYVPPEPVGSGGVPVGPGSGGQFTQGAGGQLAQGSGGFPAYGGDTGGPPPGSGGFDTGSGGSQQQSGSGGAQQSNSGPCNFTFTVTTVTAHGQYSPRNVGAIWITDSGGTFKKTLMTWGFFRLGNATAWTSVSASNTVDAVTGATRPDHSQPLTATWNCSDTSHNTVPDGAYKVSVTFAEDDSFGFFGPPPHVASVDFTKGAGPVDLSPPNQSNFINMHLTLQ
jgi:hypothetical protein